MKLALKMTDISNTGTINQKTEVTKQQLEQEQCGQNQQQIDFILAFAIENIQSSNQREIQQLC